MRCGTGLEVDNVSFENPNLCSEYRQCSVKQNPVEFRLGQECGRPTGSEEY
jgi:hypothetical protein